MAEGTTAASPSPRVQALRDPKAIRARATQLLELTKRGELAHFTVDLEALPAVADLVARTTRANYPSLEVPVHGRFRHFDVGGVPRLARLREALASREPRERARALVDLVVVSVLLDAGAGNKWVYREASGAALRRSEGLAVASLYMFDEGVFATSPRDPLRVDGEALQRFTPATLTRGFQVCEENPLEGLEGRANLVASLGIALAARPDLFGSTGGGRPGGLVDALFARAVVEKGAPTIKARDILDLVLVGLGPIWPGRTELDGENLGDVWRHSRLGAGDQGLVPFHKLSQWLSYSLVEPLTEAGLVVKDLHELTALAEYRNGGLFLDGGVLRLKDPSAASKRHRPGDDLVIEWRALTIALVDLLHPLVAERLGLTVEGFPMGCLLEGGTWAAGRKLAESLREGAPPPLTLDSDGTVF